MLGKKERKRKPYVLVAELVTGADGEPSAPWQLEAAAAAAEAVDWASKAADRAALPAMKEYRSRTENTGVRLTW